MIEDEDIEYLESIFADYLKKNLTVEIEDEWSWGSRKLKNILKLNNEIISEDYIPISDNGDL